MKKTDSGLVRVGASRFGKGLFATRDIARGVVVCRVAGKEINFQQTVLMKEKESHALQIDFDKYIICEDPFLYTNHSCDPNCGVNTNMDMITLRDVRGGEELFWDYSTSMLERHWTMPCACGEKACRKIVTDFDLLPAGVQMKYMQLKIVFPFIVCFLEQSLGRTG